MIMPVLQMKNLKLRGVTQATDLVPKGVTGPVSKEFPNSLSSCAVGSFSQWEYKVASGRP